MDKTLSKIMRLFSTSDSHYELAKTIADQVPASSGLTANEVAGQSLAIAAAVSAGDLGILNFALTLEHFEDALYQALINSKLLTGVALQYAQAYGAQEHTHVVTLTDVITKLGGTPVAALDKYNFPALATEADARAVITQVEDVGASAYLGAAPLIQDGGLLTAAVTIHTVEAEHATVWHFVSSGGTDSGLEAMGVGAFPTPRNGTEVLKIVTPFLTSPRAYLPIVVK